MNNFIKRRGFTLVELLVVIAIIGILASTITVTVGSQTRKSRDARRKQDLQTIKTAINKMEVDEMSIPQGTSTIAGVPGIGAFSTQANWNSTTFLGNKKILSALPTDPLQNITSNYSRHIINSSDTISTSTANRFKYGYHQNGSDSSENENYIWKLSSLMENDSDAVGNDGGQDTTLIGTTPPQYIASAHCFEIYNGNGGAGQPCRAIR